MGQAVLETALPKNANPKPRAGQPKDSCKKHFLIKKYWFINSRNTNSTIAKEAFVFISFQACRLG
jgi:hypothetical protein